MSTELLLKTLSQDYSYLFESGSELADVEVKVGEEQKIYKAHSLVLWTRSMYFRSEIWGNKEEHTVDDIISFSLPDMTPKTFSSLLKYMYTGELELAAYDSNLKNVIYLMLGANDLGLTSLMNHVQGYLTSRKNRLKDIFFFITRNTKGKVPQLHDLCDSILVENPLSIINSPEFLKVDKEELLYFYENLPTESMSSFPEIVLWDKLVEWGKRRLKLPKDNNNFGVDEWESLKQLVEPFIQYINFAEIRREDFLTKVKPYKSILNQEFYIELLERHTDDPQPQKPHNQQFQQPQKPHNQPLQQPLQQSPNHQTQQPRSQRGQHSKQQNKKRGKGRNPQQKMKESQFHHVTAPGILPLHQQMPHTIKQTNVTPFGFPSFSSMDPQNREYREDLCQDSGEDDEYNDDDSLSSISQDNGYLAFQYIPSQPIIQPIQPIQPTITKTLEGGPSVIIKPSHFVLLKTWINMVHNRFRKNDKYDFNLLLRGSISGFSASNFHRRCNLKGATITLLKVHETNEILGGYNPLSWESPPNKEVKFLETNQSFIFSLDFLEVKNSIFSRVKEGHKDKAIFLSQDFGPSFGSSQNIVGDLRVYGNNFSNCSCRNLMYEKGIRSSRSKFSLSEYEVFQVVVVSD